MTLAELLRHCEQKFSACAGIEPLHAVFYCCPAFMLAPDQYLHHSAFCRAIKMRSGNLSCAENKRRSLELAVRGRNFCGFCPHGVWEYASVIMLDGAPGGVLYCGALSPEKSGEFRQQADSIRSEMAFVIHFIQAEYNLFRASGGLAGKQRPGECYLENCRRFIDLHYKEKIALSDLARLLRVNPNYLGALIRRESSQTFREMLNARRIAEAQIYLKLHLTMSIGRIANLCGFSDSNYFSTVFRRSVGRSPGEYRNSIGG